MLNNKSLAFLILIEGFTTIAIEILAIRQVVPFVGSNVLNTSIIIGVFLLALALGYYRGGLVEKDFIDKLLKNLSLVFVFLSFSFSHIFLTNLFNLFPSLFGLIVFSVFIVAPMVFWLGQTIPITTNMVKNERNGKTSGRLLFISTFGSFLGSILTSVLLLNFFGTTVTIYVVEAAVGFLILLLIIKKTETSSFMLYSVGLLIFSLAGATINNDYTFIKTNNYSSIDVVEDNTERYLLINNSNSSTINIKDGKPSTKYIKTVNAYIDSFKSSQKKKVLSIGAGGFCVSIEDKKNEYSYVDIDSDLLNIAEKEFLKKPINGKFFADDGRAFLIHSKDKYDIVLVDVFSNRNAIPPSFTTLDFFRDVKKALNHDGICIINTIGIPLFRDAFSHHLKNTVEKEFICNSTPVDTNLSALQNIIYICSKRKDDVVYTDSKINLLEASR